jgi:hypothetical protein
MPGFRSLFQPLIPTIVNGLQGFSKAPGGWWLLTFSRAAFHHLATEAQPFGRIDVSNTLPDFKEPR